MPARPQSSPLLGELNRATRLARDTQLQDALAACHLTTKASSWGLEYVEFHALFYEPSQQAGDAALIVPVLDDGELVDLVACRLSDRRIATRCGNARVLGGEWIDAAVEKGWLLPLHSDPCGWLCNGRRGAVIVDWSRASAILDGVEALVCTSRSLAARVHATTRRMIRPPRIHFVQRSTRHVA